MNAVETIESCSVTDGISLSPPLLALLVVLIGYIVLDYYLEGLNKISLKAVGLAIIPFSVYFTTHGCWERQYSEYGIWAAVTITFSLFFVKFIPIRNKRWIF